MTQNEIIQNSFNFKHSVERFTLKTEARGAMDEWAKEQAISFAQWVRRKIYYNIGIGDFLWKENDEIAPEIDTAFDIFKSETSKQ